MMILFMRCFALIICIGLSGCCSSCRLPNQQASPITLGTPEQPLPAAKSSKYTPASTPKISVPKLVQQPHANPSNKQPKKLPFVSATIRIPTQ